MSSPAPRHILLSLLLVCAGASLLAFSSPVPAQGGGRLVEFVRSAEGGKVRTVAVNDRDARYVHITGMSGMGAARGISEDISEQAAVAFSNLDRELKAAGLKKADVVKLTIYVKNLDLVEGGMVLRESQKYFGSSVSPLITWVGVTSLVLPKALVEIEAFAVAAK